MGRKLGRDKATEKLAQAGQRQLSVHNGDGP